MPAIQAQPFQAPQATQRSSPASLSSTGSDDAAASKAADKAAAKAAGQAAQQRNEQAARPTTNSQGQTIGARLNVSA